MAYSELAVEAWTACRGALTLSQFGLPAIRERQNFGPFCEKPVILFSFPS